MLGQYREHRGWLRYPLFYYSRLLAATVIHSNLGKEIPMNPVARTAARCACDARHCGSGMSYPSRCFVRIDFRGVATFHSFCDISHECPGLVQAFPSNRVPVGDGGAIFWHSSISSHLLRPKSGIDLHIRPGEPLLPDMFILHAGRTSILKSIQHVRRIE